MEYNGEVSPGDQSFQQSDAENISLGTSFDGSKQTADGIVNKKLSKPILKKCKAGKKKITNKRETRKIIKKLKSRKKYFVRVRAYSKVGGSGSATVYSGWSAVKKIKVK